MAAQPDRVPVAVVLWVFEQLSDRPISIVVPVLNEAAGMRPLLLRLQYARELGAEVIVVDGGSSDESVQQARGLADRVLSSTTGRAVQLDRGIGVAEGKLVWFIHADSTLSDSLIDTLFRIESGASTDLYWGRFDVRLDDASWPFRIIETMMNWRSRWTGIATGDQGIFVSRQLLTQAGGIPQLPLMEDIELSSRLRRVKRPLCPTATIGTSARRWKQNGIVRTVFKMWALRLAYFFGVPASLLARWYYPGLGLQSRRA